MSRSTNQTQIFLSADAQQDNLGDVVIRRTALEWVLDATSNEPVVVYTGSIPEDFVVAMGLDNPRISRMSEALPFQRRLMAMALLRRATMVLMPGPRVAPQRANAFRSLGAFMSTTNNFARMVQVLASASFVKLLGGDVISIGRAYRGTSPVFRVVERQLARTVDIYHLRDNESRRLVGLGDVQPDMAFYNPNLPFLDESERQVCAISLRSDYQISQTRMDALIANVRQHDIEPVFVTQVRRDEAQHQRLAQRYACRHIEWNDRTMEEQLQRVEDLYQHARLVISDRLHALIFGLRNGAAPVAIVHNGNTKLPPTLEVTGWYGQIDASEYSEDDIASVLSSLPSQEQITKMAIEARCRLEELRGQVRKVLSR